MPSTTVSWPSLASAARAATRAASGTSSRPSSADVPVGGGRHAAETATITSVDPPRAPARARSGGGAGRTVIWSQRTDPDGECNGSPPGGRGNRPTGPRPGAGAARCSRCRGPGCGPARPASPAGPRPARTPPRSTTTRVTARRSSSTRRQVPRSAATSAPTITYGRSPAPPASSSSHRVDGVARPSPVDLDAAGLEPGNALDGRLDHPEAVLGRRDRAGIRPSATARWPPPSAPGPGSSASRAHVAATRWPTCTGSKVPPKIPVRAPEPGLPHCPAERAAAYPERRRRPFTL